MAKDTKNHAAGNSGGDSRRISVSSVTVVVLLLVACGLSFFFLTRYGPLSDSESVRLGVSSSTESPQLLPMVDLGEFIVNIISEDSNHYLKASITVQLADDKTVEQFARLAPQIRDAVLMLASNKTFEELYDMHGKKQLKAELLMEINTILTNGGAVAIYYTDFVVQ